jgi:hypothetical protein
MNTVRRMPSRTSLAIAAVLALAGCTSGSSTKTLTPAQVTTDLTGALTALSTLEGLIVAASPNAISKADQATINTDLTAAQTALASIAETTPAATGASTVATIDGYLNTAVGILAAVSAKVPGLSTFSPEIDAVDAVLPAVETFVNQNLAASITAASTGARRIHSTRFTLAQARAMLRIPVKQ